MLYDITNTVISIESEEPGVGLRHSVPPVLQGVELRHSVPPVLPGGCQVWD